jgi:hypothetical protein
MLPGLQPVKPEKSDGTGFGNTYYLRRIDGEAVLNARGRRRFPAIAKLRLTDPQEADRRLCNSFNRSKYNAFAGWWRSMLSHYPEHPEWVYCVLRRVFSSSDNHTRTPVPEFQLEAVQKLAGAVRTGQVLPTVGLCETYRLIAAGLDADRTRHLRNGWTRISLDDCGQGQDAQQKIDLLSYLGARGRWCVAGPVHGSHGIFPAESQSHSRVEARLFASGISARPKIQREGYFEKQPAAKTCGGGLDSASQGKGDHRRCPSPNSSFAGDSSLGI